MSKSRVQKDMEYAMKLAGVCKERVISAYKRTGIRSIDDDFSSLSWLLEDMIKQGKEVNRDLLIDYGDYNYWTGQFHALEGVKE